MLRAVSVAGGTQTMTYYFGPFVHEGIQNGACSLKYIITPEGRLLNSGSDGSPVWKWEYNLTDHLGNVRVVITPHTTAGYATLLQEDNYFPFGMKISQLSTSITTTNDYLYNGKQLQTNFNLNWYDYGARFYDPALGRWHSVDPMAELYNSCSHYSYVLNNPVNLFDPNGMYSMFFNGEEVDGDAKRNLQSRMGLPDDNNSDETSSNVETGIPTSFGDLLGQFGKFIGLGLKKEIGSSDFDQKQSQASENREMTILVIETANGMMSLLVPLSSLADLMSQVEAGHGLASLAAVPFVVLDVASAGASSKAKLTRQVLNSWENVNFRSISSTIRYHIGKHGSDVSIAKYTDDALNFYKANKQLGTPITLRNGAEAIKIRLGNGKPGGIFTTDGKIVSFWYK